MSTRKYRKLKRQSEAAEARRPLETLLSGKAGPLPMDNDLTLPPESAGPTKGKTRSSVSVESLGPYMSGLAARIKEAYPNLTDEELTSMLAGM